MKTLHTEYEKHVVRNDGCWDWSGPVSKNPGYAEFSFGPNKYRAHRASWMIHFGEIPKEMFVCHKCDNKRCSNPEHLFLGTCRENNLDAISKNIHPTMGKSREENHCTKIFEKDFDKIKELYKQGLCQSQIGKIFGSGQTAISKVLRFLNTDKKKRKITVDQAKEIKKMLAESFSQYDIADKYNVSQSSISKICSGKIWRHA